MPNLQINSTWLPINLELSKSTYMSVDILSISDKHEINILYLAEPSGISKISVKQVIKLHEKWDYILTWNHHLLHLPNAILFEYGTTWVGESHKNIEKSSFCSMICGDKNGTDGHNKRIQVFTDILQNTKINKFFSKKSSWRIHKKSPNMFELDVGGNDRLNAFKSKFHICIENCSENSYFSEKIIDCFLTKTIPIYWGAPNIGNYFNQEGIILVDDFKNINDAINYAENLDINKYQEVIEENYNIAVPYVDYHKRIKDRLIDLVGI